jgi:hypothetical protein
LRSKKKTSGLVPSVQPTDVLCQRSLPGDRHREEQGVKPSVVEAFAEVAAGSEDQSFPANRLVKGGVGAG